MANAQQRRGLDRAFQRRLYMRERGEVPLEDILNKYRLRRRNAPKSAKLALTYNLLQKGTDRLGNSLESVVNKTLVPLGVGSAIMYTGWEISSTVKNWLFTHIGDIVRYSGELGYTGVEMLLGGGILLAGAIEGIAVGRALHKAANNRNPGIVARTVGYAEAIATQIYKSGRQKYRTWKQGRKEGTRTVLDAIGLATGTIKNILTNTYVKTAVTLGTFAWFAMPEYNMTTSDATLIDKIIPAIKLSLYSGLGIHAAWQVYKQEHGYSATIDTLTRWTEKTADVVARRAKRTLAKAAALYLTGMQVVPPTAKYLVNHIPEDAAIEFPWEDSLEPLVEEPSTPSPADLGLLSQRYAEYMEIAQRYHIDPEFQIAIGYTESQLQHRTKKGKIQKSSAGAFGTFQITHIGYTDTLENGRTSDGKMHTYTWEQVKSDPHINAEVSAILHDLNRKRGQEVLDKAYRNPEGSLQELAFLAAAYNGGYSRVEKAMRKAGSGNFNEYAPYLPRETQNYVRFVLGFKQLFENGMAWPTESKRITDFFGTRGGGHHGIDIGPVQQGVAGEAIKATLSGVVTEAGSNILNGNWVQIQTPVEGLNNTYIVTSYLHGHTTPLVKVGDRVEVDDQILVMGNTGRSNGVHLHYEASVRQQGMARREWRYIDPLLIPEETTQETKEKPKELLVRKVTITPLAWVRAAAEKFVVEDISDTLTPKLRKLYKEGVSKEEREEYSAAITIFQTILQTYPRHSIADDVYMHMGDCYLGLDAYAKRVEGKDHVFEAKKAYESGKDLQGDKYDQIIERISAMNELNEL